MDIAERRHRDLLKGFAWRPRRRHPARTGVVTVTIDVLPL
jgi:hypothetical protein